MNVHQRRQNGSLPPYVAWLHVAPIKGLAVQERATVDLLEHGVEDDRRFCIVDSDGKMLNAKRVSRFVAVRPTLDEDARHLEVLLPDGSRAAGGIELGVELDIWIHRRQVRAREAIGPWSEALSVVAEQPVRLVRLERAGDGVDRARKGGTATVLAAESLRAIADAAGVPGPVDPRRFRMLIGVAGVPAHAEDGWVGRRVRVGGAVIVPTGNVGRCVVTTLDPVTGVSDLDTLGALARYRGARITSEPLAFGVWARVAEPGRISLGDPVLA